MGKLIFLVLYCGFSLYGFIADCVAERWGWVVAELFTGSLLAALRGVYLTFFA